MELSLAKPQMLRKPLMLKDYLLDDLSSCSSSGFRTYPRRQCCTSVGFLLEIDLKSKPPRYVKRPPLKNPSKKPSPSAFQRAINAVKSLTFATVKPSSSTSSNKLRLTLLPRSLSRKLLKRSFWKRNDRKEIPRLKPINPLIARNISPPSDFTTTTGDRRSSSSDSDSKSNSWSDSDFTASDDSPTIGNSSEVKILNEIHHDVVLVGNTCRNKNYINKRLPNDKVVSSRRVGVKVGGDDSIDATSSSSNSSASSNTVKKWQSKEEKEQFSPVSVLDCPFADDDEDDDDDEVSSPFKDRLARMEGTKTRLMKKIKRFERLTQLEPVNLQKRIALSESDQESNESPQRHSSQSLHQDSKLDSEAGENQALDKPFKLLQLVKPTIPSISQDFKADHDNLLLDFFMEGMEEDSSSPEHATSVKLDDELLNVANSWIMGQPCELFLEWEVEKNREAYIRDMERGGTWRKLSEEKQEVALEVEIEVFASLMNELLNDLL